MELINKSAVIAMLEERRRKIIIGIASIPLHGRQKADAAYEYELLGIVIDVIDTLEVKEVDIASMADEYYDALIKEAEMDVDMAGHCRLAYYNGCKDVLNKIQKGE